MTDSTTSSDPDAMLAAAQRHIIASLNTGSTVKAAIDAAIRDGIEEIAAHNAGRRLKRDLIQLKRIRALRNIGLGCLVLVGGPIASFVGGITGIPFAGFLMTIGIILGIGLIVTSTVRYATVQTSVK